MDTRRRWLAAGALAGITLLAYLPALRGGFIWDDDNFLTLNPLIRAGDGLRRFWFTTQASDYWPVTSSTLWLEWRLWGPHPLGYHAVNVALHLAEVVLLWAILRRLRVPGAWLGALLFALHPVNVESVAWIAQRKNLMAMLFYLASIALFLRWDKGRPLPYLLSLLAFVLALLSKGSVAPLPLVLLGLVAWRRRLAPRDLLWSAPFFAAAAGFAALNVWFQTHGSGLVIRQAGLLERLLGAGAAVWFYLGKALWPARLIFVYPQWDIRASDPRWWVPLLAALAATAALLRWRARARPALFAWLYFCALLVPVMGFADIAFMEYSLVANHYEHLALIGVTTLAGAGWARWRQRQAAAALAAAIAACALCFALTWRLNRTYGNVETLYRETLRINPGSWVAQGNLGALLAGRGDLQEAVPHFQQALRLHPNYPQAHVSLGSALATAGRLPEAIAQFQAALALRPDFAEAHANLGLAEEKEGRNAEAESELERAVAINPRLAPAQENLGVLLALSGRLAEAVPHLQAALDADPDLPGARANLERARRLREAGRP
ncbi:MAG TPA: tetratricopeptide repeat protein [Opitutaceae bacterium]|nr:tetratricopeptide repeat protein [Opitutaceae bacterium]